MRRFGTEVPAEKWALALGAVYAIVNNRRDRLPAFDQIDSFQFLLGTGSARALLRKWWGVRGLLLSRRRRSAAQVLDWLVFEGHRGPFQLENGWMSGAYSWQLAWDLARLIYVAQLGLAAQYITKADAWYYVSTAALLAHSSFESWEQFGQCYLLGRHLWNKGSDARFERSVQWLATHANSPWTDLPWNLNLHALSEHFKGRPRHLFEISDSFEDFFRAFGFRRVRPFAFVQDGPEAGLLQRLSIACHISKTGELELSAGVGVRFEAVEKYLRPQRTSGLTPTLGIPLGKPSGRRVTSMDDVRALQDELAAEIRETALPYFERLGSLEKARAVLASGEGAQVSTWDETSRAMVVACFDAAVGHASAARQRLQVLADQSRKRAEKEFIRQLIERVGSKQ